MIERLVIATPTGALALDSVLLFVLKTLRIPPYDKKADAVIQYSYCPSVDLGDPNVSRRSDSVSIRTGSSTGPFSKGPAIAPT